MSERFRADLNAVSKTYIYRISVSPDGNLFTRDYTAHPDRKISNADLDAMKEAADSLIGIHDFRTFSAGKKKKGTVKEIFDISFSEQKDLTGGLSPVLTIKICANDFLYQMPERIIEFLIQKGADKKFHCDPSGLFLHSIAYPD